MIKIGLTGNAGSGKSTAVDYFYSQDINGISTDEINAEIRQHSTHVCQWLQKLLATEICDDNGKIDSKLLRKEIFLSEQSRRLVEQFLHPIIMENVELQLAILPEKSYCIVEIPLLFEADLLTYVDVVLLVTTDRKILVERISARTGLGQTEAAGILENQLADNEKFQYSNHIVINNDTKEAFQGYLEEIHQRYT